MAPTVNVNVNKDWILKQFQKEHLIQAVEQNTKASSVVGLQ